MASSVKALERLVERCVSGLHSGGCAVENHPSPIDENDAPGHGFHLLQDMCRKQDGLVLSEFADGLADLAGLVGIEAAGGFVHDQDVRLVQQHLRHAGALAIALGELLNGLLDDGFKRAAGHHGVDALLQVRAGQAPRAPEELQ